MAHRIKDIKAEYNDIVGQRRDANAIRNNLQVDHPMQKSNKIIGEASMLSNVEESKIAIRDREKDKIVSKLLDSNEEENFWIVSIVGLGGSGKTTMAKHICHVDEIKELFKNRIFWVHVSEEFDVQKLIGKLYETITGKKSDYQPQQQMVLEISKVLSGNKFLLVLDDAWHTDRYEWGQFMVHLQDRSPGSRILLTTRDQKVAEAVECKHIHDLAFLSDSDSWSLFLKISGLVENDLGSDFTQVGKDIVKRCGGVPLAIRTIAGVLREKTEIGTWRAIRGSELWNVESITDRVFASLKLSYIHLADELKQYFTFCSIFPKGCLINKDHLAAQWMAHGFVMPMKEEHPEDIASEYFVSLVKAGFFLRDTEESFDFISVYKMHDLIHDLAQYCENNKVVTSLARNMITNQTHTCRYLSLTSETEKVKRGLLDKVRALYMSDGNISFDKPVKKSCYVRSVVLDSKNLTPFPPFLLKFEYLGYLEICNVECKKIPEAISGCWNLQSLHFIRYNGFVMLPECIGKLKKLRTLELDIVDDLEGLPQSIGDCQDLQSLKIDCCDNLQGIPASIGKIENLRMLHITSCSALRKLPSKPCGEFNNLQILNLADCNLLQDLPSTFACPVLRTLNLSRTAITTLPQWVTLIDTLECIELEGCTKLVELPKGIINLGRLAVLNIEDCRKLSGMPSGFRQLIRLRKLGLFVVGCGRDDARISELETVDMISGEMEITNLKYIQDPTDADKANLERKSNIKHLVLNWSRGETEGELISDMVMEQDLAVLNALEPPSKIEGIKIYHYGGPCLPRWMRKQCDSSSWEGTTLKQASTCQLLYLTTITLQNIPKLKHMQGHVELPLLKDLALIVLPNLEEMWTTTRPATGAGSNGYNGLDCYLDFVWKGWNGY